MITWNTEADRRCGASSIMHTPVLQRIAAGEPGAFDDFMKQYRPLLMAQIRRSVGTGPRAQAEMEDVLQEVCIGIWQAAHRFDPAKGSESTFIGVMARCRLIDCYYRRRASVNAIEFASEFMGDYAEARNDERDRDASTLSERIEDALEALTLDVRDLLEQRYVRGLTSNQIAEATGLRPKVVRARIDRALNRVRASLDMNLERAAA